MTPQKLAISFLLALLLAGYSSADVVVLKNGRTLEGTITKRTGDFVTIDIGIGETTLHKNDIKSVEMNKEYNAAIYYLRAADLADYNNTAGDRNKIARFEKAGFRLARAEAEGLLGSNEKCLDKIEKALAIKKCDFYFEDKYNYTRQPARRDNQKKIMYLHSLLLLKGRYLESQKDPGRAVEEYLSALTLARQISQGPDPDFKTAGVVVEKNTYPILMEYLNSKGADPKVCARIFAYLEDYEKWHFSDKEFLVSSKEAFMSVFDSLALDITRWSRVTPGLDAATVAGAQNFADALVKAAGELADKYYGNFIRAAGAGADKDWESAVNEYKQLVKETNPPDIEDEIDMYMFVRKELGSPEEYSKKDPAKIAVAVLNAWLPYDKMTAEHYRENRGELKQLESLAYARMNKP